MLLPSPCPNPSRPSWKTALGPKDQLSQLGFPHSGSWKCVCMHTRTYVAHVMCTTHVQLCMYGYFRNSQMMGRGGRCRKGSIFIPLNHAGTSGCFKMELPWGEVQGFQLGSCPYYARPIPGPEGQRGRLPAQASGAAPAPSLRLRGWQTQRRACSLSAQVGWGLCSKDVRYFTPQERLEGKQCSFLLSREARAAKDGS